MCLLSDEMYPFDMIVCRRKEEPEFFYRFEPIADWFRTLRNAVGENFSSSLDESKGRIDSSRLARFLIRKILFRCKFCWRKRPYTFRHGIL